MAGYLNKVMIIGNVGRDPEMRYTPNGTATTSFSVAVNRRINGPDGKRRDETEWFNVVTWEKLAETCNQYVTKGTQIYIEGRLQTRTWDDKDGVKHYRTEVIAQAMQLLGSRPQSGEGYNSPVAASTAPGLSPPGKSSDGFDDDVEPDDIPF